MLLDGLVDCNFCFYYLFNRNVPCFYNFLFFQPGDYELSVSSDCFFYELSLILIELGDPTCSDP